MQHQGSRLFGTLDLAWEDTGASERIRLALRAHLRVVAEQLDLATVFIREWRYLEGERREEIVAERRRYEERLRAESGVLDGVELIGSGTLQGPGSDAAVLRIDPDQARVEQVGDHLRGDEHARPREPAAAAEGLDAEHRPVREELVVEPTTMSDYERNTVLSTREIFEREYLLAQIARFSGNISRTAEFIGMERSALHRKLKSLGIGG